MRISLAVLVASLLACPAALAAKGVPIGGVDDGAGVAARGGAYRYVTHWSHGTTTVTKRRVAGGEIVGALRLRGHYSVPLVAYDGSTSGLSADRRTLVLVRPRSIFPSSRSSFVVVDAKRLSAVRRINLRGDFGFDAIAPDASTLYLVNYPSGDERRYAVRAFDMARGALRPEPIVDPRNPDEKMVGLPVTRAMSDDGRWAYTLYDDSGGSHPFVHALDAAAATAYCIDLDALEGQRDLMSLRLSLVPGSLSVMRGGEPVARVDTNTLAATEARERPQPLAGAIAAAIAVVIGRLGAAYLSA